MAHDPGKRTALRDGYIRGLSLADAAIAAGVPYATALQLEAPKRRQR